jgi:hypothetical protein
MMARFISVEKMGDAGRVLSSRKVIQCQKSAARRLAPRRYREHNHRFPNQDVESACTAVELPP